MSAKRESRTPVLPTMRGEMARRIESFDWRATPLGPDARWPQSLRTAIGIVVASRFPMALWWGAARTQLYNDAYAPILGDKHPRALGQAANECWYEIWDVIGPMADSVKATGDATWSDDFLLVMQRHGYVEETYFTFSYSAVSGEAGEVAGTLVTCFETTPRVLSARRMDAIRRLAAAAASASTQREAAAEAFAVLAQAAKDVPFAMLYVVEDGIAHLAARTGGSDAMAPRAWALASEPGPWPVAAALRTGLPEWSRTCARASMT